MTLNDFANTVTLYSYGGFNYDTSTNFDYIRIYVLKGEENFNRFCKCPRDEKNVSEILFTLCSPFQPKMYLKPEYAEAKVLRLAALNTNVLAVEIEK